MVIAIDFDGTITVNNAYPNIGELRPHVIEAIKNIQSHGHKCFLWTCRGGKELEEAKQCLEKHGLIMDGYNESPLDYINPSCRKPIADLYIDDRAFPVPFSPRNPENNFFMDWKFIEDCILRRG